MELTLSDVEDANIYLQLDAGHFDNSVTGVAGAQSFRISPLSVT